MFLFPRHQADRQRFDTLSPEREAYHGHGHVMSAGEKRERWRTAEGGGGGGGGKRMDENRRETQVPRHNKTLNSLDSFIQFKQFVVACG